MFAVSTFIILNAKETIKVSIELFFFYEVKRKIIVDKEGFEPSCSSLQKRWYSQCHPQAQSSCEDGNRTHTPQRLLAYETSEACQQPSSSQYCSPYGI